MPKEYLSEEEIGALRALPIQSRLCVLLHYVPHSKDLVSLESKFGTRETFLSPEDHERDYTDYCQRCQKLLKILLDERKIRHTVIGPIIPALSTQLSPEQILDLNESPYVNIVIDSGLLDVFDS